MNDFFDQLIRGAMHRLNDKQLETIQVDSYPEIIIESDNIENSCGGTCVVKDACGKIWAVTSCGENLVQVYVDHHYQQSMQVKSALFGWILQHAQWLEEYDPKMVVMFGVPDDCNADMEVLAFWKGHGR